MDFNKIDEEFDLEFDGCRVVHIYETEQFEKIKSFLHQKLLERDGEVIEKIEKIDCPLACSWYKDDVITLIQGDKK